MPASVLVLVSMCTSTATAGDAAPDDGGGGGGTRRGRRDDCLGVEWTVETGIVGSRRRSVGVGVD